MFSSSAPHRRARRWLSTGSSLTSTGLALRRAHPAGCEGGRRRCAVHVLLMSGGPGKFTTRLFPVRPAVRCSASWNGPHQDALRRSDHRLADGARLASSCAAGAAASRSFRNEKPHRAAPPPAFPGAGCRRERGVEVGVARELERRLEVGLGLAREADDEVRGQADAAPRLAQPPHDRAVLERGIAALHRASTRSSPTAPEDARAARACRGRGARRSAAG